MKHFLSVKDVSNPIELAHKAIELKKNPLSETKLGKGKVLGLIFFNSSLRTRMSTTRAAYNLGMNVITLNISSDSWKMEMEDGAVMDRGSAEHIKDAIPVMSSYCDVLGVRSFPSLVDRDGDYAERVIGSFLKYSSCPIINLESATLHPCQSLADLMTIEELKRKERPKIVLTWAPHIKPLPQSVANSFAQWINQTEFDFTIANPAGLELAPEFAGDAYSTNNQDEALRGADFVYVKNWSSYRNYGQVVDHPDWLITKEKLQPTNQGKLMHCLPVRRNVVIADDAMDGEHSVIQHQAANRLYSAQIILSEILKAAHNG